MATLQWIMSIHLSQSARLAGLAVSAAAALMADFSYQENTRITGGALANMMGTGKVREPTTSTVLLKGNRMAHLRPGSAQIIDLDKGTITNINFLKKTYTVMTFAQMSQMRQDASQRTGQQPSGADADVKASVRDTGKKRTIGGFNTTEKIITMTMGDAVSKTQAGTTVNTDMWVASDIPGYAEVRNFYKRMAEKSGSSFGAMPGAGGMPQGMAALAKEMSKLQGTPVLQVMTMSGGGGAGLGALGAHGAEPASNQKAAADSGVTLEVTTESSGFSSTPVDTSKFEIPAGFQPVDAGAMRRPRK